MYMKCKGNFASERLSLSFNVIL